MVSLAKARRGLGGRFSFFEEFFRPIEVAEQQWLERERWAEASLHFFPIFLGLFLIALTLSRWCVFIGFREQDPATKMSAFLMILVCFVSAASALDERKERPRRAFASLFAVLAGGATLDELFQGHENVGYFVQAHEKAVSQKVLIYTDDFLILGATIIVAAVLVTLARRVTRDLVARCCLYAAVIIALAHGLSDIFGHRTFIWSYFFGMKFTPKAGEYLLDRTSTFEEWYKIWTEWFVLLFALRLFHQRRVPFFWSLGCFAAAIFATPMLWAGADPSGAIPYLVTGGWSRIVRNPGRLLALAITWVSWAVLAWRISRESPKRAPAAALLFFLPLMLGLNAQGALGVGAAVTGLVVGSLFGEFTVAFFLLNALLLVAVLTHSLPLQGVLLVGGAAVGSALRKRSPLPASLLLLGLSASVFLFHGGFLYVSLSVFLLGGGLLAWTLTGIACLSRETRTFLPLLAATFLLSFLLSSLGGGALFWGSVILALLSSELPLQRFRWDGKRFLSAFGHLLTVLIAVNAFFPPFLPNRHFRYARHPRYVIRYQAAVVPKGRPNIDFPEERDER